MSAGDPLHVLVLAIDDDRQPRGLEQIGFADGDALDVDVVLFEDFDDLGEDSRTIPDQSRNGVFQDKPLPAAEAWFFSGSRRRYSLMLAAVAIAVNSREVAFPQAGKASIRRGRPADFAGAVGTRTPPKTVSREGVVI